CMQALDFPYTF
nr:immunoglobulin light chain junction region [Macaca mulatta]MOW39245.1 immunoglobulin light chain junction region [Macaca mulatta]MOW39320.1 immunoglobulin light chain junction region [Macaca mulatta]MOW39333.1 immunoglobulin light chain junction region [Macaca mulatta]MOW39564.1 immunoglobulin light chain junction region [Macaca mulatta]